MSWVIGRLGTASRWSLALLASFCFLDAACTPRASDASFPPPAPPPEPTPRWPRFEELNALAAVTRSFTSAHLFEARVALVRVTPSAAERYRTLVAGAALDAGTLLVEELRRRPTEAPDTFLVMEKRENGWTYLKLDAQGRPTEVRDDLCQRCHAEGLADELFGPGQQGVEPAPGE